MPQESPVGLSFKIAVLNQGDSVVRDERYAAPAFDVRISVCSRGPVVSPCNLNGVEGAPAEEVDGESCLRDDSEGFAGDCDLGGPFFPLNDFTDDFCPAVPLIVLHSVFMFQIGQVSIGVHFDLIISLPVA